MIAVPASIVSLGEGAFLDEIDTNFTLNDK